MASPLDNNKKAGSSTQPLLSFTAFSQFIDEHISNMLHSLIGLPSASPIWQSRGEVEEDGRSGRRFSEIHQRQMDTTRDSALSPSYSNLDSTRVETPTSPSSEFEEAMVDKHRVCVPLRFEADQSLPDDGIERCQTSETLKRLQSYLDDSPYSPVQLEQDPDLQYYPPIWRSAFLDLMNTTQGGEKYPGIAQNIYLHLPVSEPDTWKALLLKNFSYVYHQNHVHRILTTNARGHELKIAEGLENVTEYIRLAQDDDLRHQRNFFTTVKRHHPYICPSVFVRMFMVAGDRRPGDDDYEARYLGHLSKDASFSKSWMLWKLAQEHDGPQLIPWNEPFPLLDTRKSSVLDRLVLMNLLPRADGIVGQACLIRTRFPDGSFATEDRMFSITEMHGSHEASPPAETPKELQIDPHEADKPAKIKKGGWFWR